MQNTDKTTANILRGIDIADESADDALLLALDSAHKTQSVKGGRKGESRAWQRSGNVD